MPVSHIPPALGFPAYAGYTPVGGTGLLQGGRQLVLAPGSSCLLPLISQEGLGCFGMGEAEKGHGASLQPGGQDLGKVSAHAWDSRSPAAGCFFFCLPPFFPLPLALGAMLLVCL